MTAEPKLERLTEPASGLRLTPLDLELIRREQEQRTREFFARMERERRDLERIEREAQWLAWCI